MSTIFSRSSQCAVVWKSQFVQEVGCRPPTDLILPRRVHRPRCPCPANELSRGSTSFGAGTSITLVRRPRRRSRGTPSKGPVPFSSLGGRGLPHLVP